MVRDSLLTYTYLWRPPRRPPQDGTPCHRQSMSPSCGLDHECSRRCRRAQAPVHNEQAQSFAQPQQPPLQKHRHNQRISRHSARLTVVAVLNVRVPLRLRSNEEYPIPLKCVYDRRLTMAPHWRDPTHRVGGSFQYNGNERVSWSPQSLDKVMTGCGYACPE